MEPQQHHPQPPHEDSSSSSSSSKSSFLCRQPSTRWIPTTDQIRILRDLYYNNGVRSPSAEQIQRISARLRQYGKIEGKNVFYWFQNHKARERQKKRFTVDISMQNMSNKYTNTFTGVSSSSPSSTSSSSGVLSVSQMGGIGCGSLIMEKSFRECSISASSGIGTIGDNTGWVGVEQPYLPPYALFDPIKPNEMLQGEAPDTETLQLFPMRGEDTAGFSAGKRDTNLYIPGCYSDGDKDGCRTSLELSLNSYAGDRSDST